MLKPNCTFQLCREKEIEKTILRILGSSTFSHSPGAKRTFADSVARYGGGGTPSKVTSRQKARGAALGRFYRGNASFSFEREIGSRNCRNARTVKSIRQARRRENTSK
jgi:hypothetical protein